MPAGFGAAHVRVERHALAVGVSGETRVVELGLATQRRAGRLGGLAEGALLAVGNSVLLEVVEKGKKPGEPHSYDYRGWCLLPVSGYFLSVDQGGVARRGDSVKVL